MVLRNCIEMVGGGIRRDDGAIGISSTNVFAALDTLKKKKKSSGKDRKGSPKRQGSSKAPTREPEPPQIMWVPTPLNKSWADVDDDDDDDYYKSAPVLPSWGSAQTQDNKDVMARSGEEDSESEDDGLIGVYDVEDEPEQEHEASIPDEPISKNPTPAPVALKDPEKPLSKKELKKKELEELDVLLAEFSVSIKEEKSTGPVDTNAAADDEDGNENTSTQVNIKTSKKKKVKKEKSSVEVEDVQKQTNDSNASDGAAGAEPMEDSVSSEADIKEKLKKIASKKKKSTKDTDAPSKAAAIEAAARSAKLAAAKKKEKSHYNQQPVR